MINLGILLSKLYFRVFMTLYSMSYIADALDGTAARYFGQCKIILFEE